MTPPCVRAGFSPRGSTREWRQLHLLSRDSVRQLLHAASLSRSGDPMRFALWVLAAVAAFPAAYSARAFIRWAGSPAGASPGAIEFMIVHDRLVFLFYAMIASAVLAAVLWEALVPGTADQEALGALPVRPRTVAAARLAAALVVALALAAAIALPSGVVFGIIALMVPGLGFGPLVAVAHVLTVCGGALFVFGALLALRAAAAVAASPHAADRLAFVLQLATIVGLVGVFLYVPTVVPFLVRETAGGAWGSILPPVWFAALYGDLTGSDRTFDNPHGARAIVALSLAMATNAVLYLVPAARMARRALEAQSRRRAGRAASLTRAVSAALLLRPQTASLFEFTLASLFRSPRHLLMVAGYLGAGIGLGAVSVITAELRGALMPAPQPATLAFPLVVIFLLIFGFRSAFRIPADLPAGWPFRLYPPSVWNATGAARTAVLVLGVLPVAVVTLAAARIAGWTWDAALAVGTFDLLMGALLVECVLYGWAKVPFACPHAPDGEAVKVRWLLGLVALNIFAARGADIQLLALRSTRGTLILIAVLLAAIATVRLASRREAQRLELEFDEPPETSMQALNLSEALR